MEKKKFQDMRRVLQEHNYDIIKSIGRGAFGEVLLVRAKKDEELYAVKVISKLHIKKKPYLQKYINQEISIMKNLNHPNIVCYEHEIVTADFIIIIMEYCEQGNLLTYQSKLPGKIFPLASAVKVIVDVMKGLKCIHEKMFIHRDIKSQNVLLRRKSNFLNGANNLNEMIFKIADFGFARSIGGVGAKTHCGTQKYMAPEIISNSYYGISVDIWALGVLFYFMLFAEYPFRGHDMKAEINRKCGSTQFNLSNNISKKQKLKDVTPAVQDFFRRIFVIDSKKRLSFSNIQKHPLFEEYESQFQENHALYSHIQQNEEYVKDDQDKNQYGIMHNMQAEDQSRSNLFKKKKISGTSEKLSRELQEIIYQAYRVEYLKQCATQLFDNYSLYLDYQNRLAAKYYLLKAYIFYSDPLLRDLTNNKMPQSLENLEICSKWSQCVQTEEYKKCVQLLSEQNMQGHIMFEDTYAEVSQILLKISVKNFEKGYKSVVEEKTFDELKFSYRSTTSHIFKCIHEHKSMDTYTKNKIKMRLFCCHMINRIFNRKQIKQHFPYFVKWLKVKGFEYPHSFDFIYFKKWIYEETQQNLQKNITLLHKTFF